MLECNYQADTGVGNPPNVLHLESTTNNSLQGDAWEYEFMKRSASCIKGTDPLS